MAERNPGGRIAAPAESAAWCEVSLTVENELAEAVAEVLSRFAPNGVVIETPIKNAPPGNDQTLAGIARVCAYLPVDLQLEEKRHKLEEALWYLGRIRPLPEAQFRTVQESDWAEAWKAHYHPLKIGKRLVIVPAWLENPHPEMAAVRMDPGMAFGTGTHPSTQLCLELIEELTQPGMTLIDIGCGSGILAVAALKLGAARALGVDNDPLAVRVASQNAELNGVEDRLEMGVGSVAQVLSGGFALRQADIVVANILAPVIIQLIDEGLGDLLVPGGSLVLAGILDTQAAEVEAALEGCGLRAVEVRQSGDWVAMRVMMG